VHARFGAAAAHVNTISFDYSSHGMATGKHAGEAARQLGVIHVNANFVLTEGIDASWRSGAPVSLPVPWSSLDATTAHELWHKIELAWETEHYAESIEFRRAVGALFGKATIEQVFTDEAARAVLASEVSAYATTNRVEATAEMFELFWCGPPPNGSIAEQFGAIVDRFF
jgi:DNA-binding XRE family transcriptional regulator